MEYLNKMLLSAIYSLGHVSKNEVNLSNFFEKSEV
jgi:hypothetical protein